MKRLFTTTLILLLIVILGTSGVKSVQNSSSPNTGYTGATGNYCNNCHSGNTLNASGGGITVTGLPGGYSSNTVYTFSITINHASSNRKRWGFAIKAVNANGAAIGTFTSSNANANVSSGELRHLNAPTLATGTNTYTYANLKWASPINNALADKKIRFFIAAVAADGSGGSDADFVYSKLVTISPATAIKSFTPTKGISGTLVSIKGNSFTNTTDVSFGGIPAQSFTVNTDSTITAIVGNGASGNVSVTSPSGTATQAGFIFCAVTPTTINDSLTGCNSVTFGDSTYFGSAIRKDTIKTSNSCDSIYKITKITVKQVIPTNQNINQNACDKFIYKNVTYISSSIIKDTLRTLEGCDSIYLTINATINPSINGKVIHPTKGSIANVKIDQTGTTATTITANGTYSATCIAAHSNVVLKPSKNNDISKANGVTSIDALLTQRHILNVVKLNSPYKIIAADVNGDKAINSVDVLRIKRLILGTDTTFASALRGNRLWEFVDSSYQFIDTTNPFPFKDSIAFSNLTTTKNNQTFIGIKLGDVNYDWNSAVAKGVATSNLQLIANSERRLSTTNFQFSAINFKNLVALQYTLHFDNTKYEFVGIVNNKIGIDFNANKANTTGDIAILWTDKNAESKTLEDGSELFTLVLKNKGLISNSELSLSNDIVAIEAWDNNFNNKNIVLTKSKTQKLPIAVNNLLIYPNPTSNKVTIETAEARQLYILDYLGRQVFTKFLTNNSQTVVNNLPMGIYVIKVIMADKTETISKLIIN